MYAIYVFIRYFGSFMDIFVVCFVWDEMSEFDYLELVLSEVKGWVDLLVYFSWKNCSR